MKRPLPLPISGMEDTALMALVSLFHGLAESVQGLFTAANALAALEEAKASREALQPLLDATRLPAHVPPVPFAPPPRGGRGESD